MSVFLIFVIPVLDPAIQKTQGTVSRYARRKHRASAKVLAAAGVAVKLATACALQQRFSPQPVLRLSWLQLALKGVPLSSRQQLVICRLNRRNYKKCLD